MFNTNRTLNRYGNKIIVESGYDLYEEVEPPYEVADDGYLENESHLMEEITVDYEKAGEINKAGINSCLQNSSDITEVGIGITKAQSSSCTDNREGETDNSGQNNYDDRNVENETEKIDTSFSDDDNGSDTESNVESETDNEDDNHMDSDNINRDDDLWSQDEMIYEGGPFTLYDSFLTVLAMVLRHRLTAVCLIDILEVIALHLPKRNVYKRSLHFFRNVLRTCDTVLNYHYFCSFCYTLLPNMDTKCKYAESHGKKEEEKKKNSYFIEIPLLHQIQSMMARKGIYTALQYRFTRSKNESSIRDIYDGEIYKKYHKFFSYVNNISLMFYTDGISLFKKNKKSLWPIYFTINELPPHLRYRRENLLVAGLWFADEKPDPNVFMKPMMTTFQSLLSGFPVTPYQDTEVNFRAMVLCAVCDMPAKNKFLNMISSVGAYRCHICLVKGHSVQIKVKRKVDGEMKEVNKGSKVWVYPFQESTSAEMRDHNQFNRTAEELNKMREKKPSVKSLLGIKGPTIMSKLMPDIVFGVGIDIMHGIFEGVMKLLLELWFNASHRAEDFSIRNFVGEVDKKLKKINLPWYITSNPRSISQDFAYWKASEFRSFFFYYGLQVLSGILPANYLDHFATLVYCIWLLNSDSVSIAALDECEDMLRRFVQDFELLYGERYMSMNVHQILHLPLVVRHLGPLWVYTCFRFEDFNGRILDLFHGTRFAADQIATNILLLRDLPLKVENLKSDTLKSFCRTILTAHQNLKFTERIDANSFTVGVYTFINHMPLMIRQAMISSELQVPKQGILFKRLKLKSMLFASKSYTRCSNSYFVSFLDDTGVVSYGIIETFLRISICECSCNKCRCIPAQFYAIVRSLRIEPFNATSNVLQKIVHIKQYQPTEYCICLPVGNLISVLISFDNFICDVINSVERE